MSSLDIIFYLNFNVISKLKKKAMFKELKESLTTVTYKIGKCNKSTNITKKRIK